MNQIKIFKLLLLVGVLATAHINSNAQVCGYGVGTNTISSTTHSSGTLYTDDVRAEVNGITYSTNNDYVTVTLNSSYTYGTFAVGDAVIIIQMEGTTGNPEGVHRNGMIDQIYTSGSTTYYKVDAKACPNGGGLSTFPTTLTVGSGFVLQMIRIREYSDFTLSGGQVTCNAWDGHTGGVLCMVTTGNLTVNGGFFNVSGKGYFDDNITWGTGGTGGPGTSGGTSGTGTSANSTVELCMGISYNTVTANHPGSAGYATTSANDGAGGTNTSGSTDTRVAPVYGSKAVMGLPGSFTSSTGGGDGAQGGAGGGDGGNNTTCSLTGGAGASGQSGQNGGDAGESGKGAGVIIIKIGGNLVRGSGLTSTVLFWANGENGDAGENGGQGGQGGIGGTAAPGCCSGGGDITCSAGGRGQSGTGGDGGDGGSGGKAGCIWLVTAGTNGMSSSNVQAKGGNGGVGGPGGWGWPGLPNANPTEYKNSSCNSNSCTAPGGGGGGSNCPSWITVEICNPEKVFCLLGQNARSAVTSLSNSDDVDFFNSSSGFIGSYIKASSTSGFSYLFAEEDDISTCTKYRYYTLLYSRDICADIFQSMKTSPGLPTPSGATINFTNTSVSNCPPGSGGWVETLFRDNQSPAFDAIQYKELKITSFSAPNRPVCYAMICPPDELYTPGLNGAVETSGSGTAGADGTDGADETGNSDNVTLEGGATWKMLPTGVQQKIVNAQMVRCYPNPANKQLTIATPGLKEKIICTIELTDVTGKTIYTQTQLFDNTTKIMIDVSSFARGVYILKFTGKSINTYTQKITVQ